MLGLAVAVCVIWLVCQVTYRMRYLVLGVVLASGIIASKPRNPVVYVEALVLGLLVAALAPFAESIAGSGVLVLVAGAMALAIAFGRGNTPPTKGGQP